MRINKFKFMTKTQFLYSHLKAALKKPTSRFLGISDCVLTFKKIKQFYKNKLVMLYDVL